MWVSLIHNLTEFDQSLKLFSFMLCSNPSLILFFLSLPLSLRAECQNGMSVDLFLHCSLVPSVSTACVQTKLSPLKTNMQNFF